MLSQSLGLAVKTQPLRKLEKIEKKKKTRMDSCISSTMRPCKGQPHSGHKFSGTGALYQLKGMSFHLCISPKALT